MVAGVVFVVCECSFELTNSGCQYWVSMATRLSSTNECDSNVTLGHVASGTEFTANQ
jgi:hypothetical protein